MQGWDANTAGRVSFFVPKSEDEFLSSVFVLSFGYTITKSDGTNLDPGINVATESMPFISFFSDMELSVSLPFSEPVKVCFFT